MSTGNHSSGTEAFDAAASTFRNFDPRRYFYDPESLREAARADAHRIHEREAERDWQAVREAAARMMDRGEDRLRRLLRGRTVLNDVARAAEDLQTYLELGDRSDGSLDVEAVRNDPRLTTYPELLRQQRDLAIWYVASGYTNLARVSLYAIGERAEVLEHPPETVDAIEDEIEGIRETAMDRFRDLYGALAGAEWDDLEAHAWRATSYPIEVLADLYAMDATLRAGRRYETERADGAAGQAADFARGQLEIHRAIRLLGLLLAAGYRFLFVARQGGVDEESRQATEAAGEKHFESLVADGVNVGVGDLIDDAGAYDGRLVEVEGFAENVRIDDGDFVTKFDVVDRLHDRRLVVAYPYHDLTAWHLHDDAYVRIEGWFESDSEWTGGPELQVDTVSVGENGEDSWFDSLVGEFAGSGVFERYPSHGNLCWSHEPPGHGGGDHH